MINHNAKGFTLIEIIVSLVLMAIIAAVVSMGFVQVVKGYVFAKNNNDAVEKGQIAIIRVVKELSNCNVIAGSATSVTFNRRSDHTTHTFAWINGETVLRLDGDTLTDQVNSFALAYLDKDGNAAATATASKQVQIILQLNVIQVNISKVERFTNRVYLAGGL